MNLCKHGIRQSLRRMNIH